VPGSGGGSFPDRTQFENVVGERLQYAAACCRFSKRGLSGVIDDMRADFENIVELTAEMVSQEKLGRTAGPMPPSKWLRRAVKMQLARSASTNADNP